MDNTENKKSTASILSVVSSILTGYLAAKVASGAAAVTYFPFFAPIAAGIGSVAAFRIAAGGAKNAEEKQIKNDLDKAMENAWEWINAKYKLTDACISELKTEIAGSSVAIDEFVLNSRGKGLEQGIAAIVQPILEKYSKELEENSEAKWDSIYTREAALDISTLIVNAISQVLEDEDRLEQLKKIEAEDNRTNKTTRISENSDEFMDKTIIPLLNDADGGLQHYITKIHVNRVRHLENIDIDLGAARKHLILTGKNGSGKTSLLQAIKDNLLFINTFADNYTHTNKSEAVSGILIDYNCDINTVPLLYVAGLFVTAFYPANRLSRMEQPRGVEDIKLKLSYSVDEGPVADFVKYMVHLKTQQSFANNAGDTTLADRIQRWFNDFERALKRLFDDDSVCLEYDFRNYNFLIKQTGRNSYDFNQLPDGYSALLRIMADLVLRMDHNWLMNDTDFSREVEGVVLIDEIETHLHLALQRTVLPFLTEMFPNIQFIVSTHSPFIVNSLEDAVIYDLERHITVSHGLANVPYEGVVEGYFQADNLSQTLRKKFQRYKELVSLKELTKEDYAEIAELSLYLDEIPDYLALELSSEYQRLKIEFKHRKVNNGQN